jgi:hypothetical protein
LLEWIARWGIEVYEGENGANSKKSGTISRAEGLAVANPPAVENRRCPADNGAGGVVCTLEHAPPSSSHKGTTRPSAGVREFSEKLPLHRRQGDDRCTCPKGS